MIELSGQEIHTFDEAWAGSIDMLMQLVASFIRTDAEHRADGLPQAVCILGLADWLGREWDHDQLVSALCAATVLIAEHTELAAGQ